MASLHRVHKRISRYWSTIRLLRNWKDVLQSELLGAPIATLQFRNGYEIQGGKNSALTLLFNEIWINRIYTQNGYEIRPADVVVDLGANLGTFAFLAASLAPEGQVHACEPAPLTNALLRTNVARSGIDNISVHECAVTGRVGTVSLYACAQNDARSSVYQSWSPGSREEVQSLTLDAMFEHLGIDHCDFLKMDIEGSEYEALRSGTAALEVVNRFVCEYHRIDGCWGPDAISKLIRGAGLCMKHHLAMDSNTGIVYAQREKNQGARR